MSTICSFKLKPAKRVIAKIRLKTHSIGAYIRFERLKRKITQTTLAKNFGVTNVTLSNWESNRKQIHPKNVNDVINFLGYVPKKISSFDKLGVQTQLWRLQNNISIKDFAQLTQISEVIISKVEMARYCNIDSEIENRITAFIGNRKAMNGLSHTLSKS